MTNKLYLSRDLRSLTTILLVFIFLGVNFYESRADDQINQITQRVIANFSSEKKIPGTEGLAGVFAGVHQNTLFIAGGTAFPEGKPWDGGQKVYSDAILIYQRTANGTLRQLPTDIRLPKGVGEGASVTTPQGLICLGGQTANGLSADVFQISYTSGAVQVSRLPSLPEPIKFASAAAIGSKVYVAGGETQTGATGRFLALDLSIPSTGWLELPPLPIPVYGPMMATQMDGEEISVFLFGGRARMPGAETTAFFSHVFRYSPSKGQWEQLRDIAINGKQIRIAMGNAYPVGASHIVLEGGDTGLQFNQVELAMNRISSGDLSAVAERDSLWINHPGFNPNLYVYNTITDTWFADDSGDLTPTAVASGVNWDNHLISIGGEIRPATRTGEIREITFTVKPVFGWLNYLVLAIYFIGMLLLGFYFMKKEGDTNDFFKAGGRIPWWAAGISIFATTLSAITFIAIPAKSYATDWRMFTFNLTIILIVPVVIRYFLPFFRRFNFDTAYEYLDARFNRSVRWLASALFVIFMVSRISIVLFLPSLALNAVTGFSVYWAIIVMGIVTIIYCTSGGIEAVVWGDVIQGFILLGGAIAALIYMLAGVEGGLGGFMDISTRFHKFHTFDFRFDFSQPVFWVVLIGGVANSLISYTSDQSVVQRYMTTRDEKATARSIWLNGFLSVPVTIIFFLLGTGLFAYYTSNPGKLAVVNPNIDSAFPQFIVSSMPAGVAGLLIAAIFAAAMSTLSSNINSAAAVITSDFHKTFGFGSSQKTEMRIARWSGIITGLLGMAMALVLATWNIASLWDQFNTFLGLMTSGLGAFFIMGIFFPRISGKAALAGVITGIIILILIKTHTTISFLLYGFIGVAISVVIAWILSFILKNNKDIQRLTWTGQKNSRQLTKS